MSDAAGPRCRLSTFDIPGRPKTGLVRLCDDARGIRMSVIPADGGEIVGIRYRFGSRWREILYRGLDYSPDPPDDWPGRAPLLWPAVGRTFLPEQLVRWRKSGRLPRALQYECGGRVYPIPLHGFARLMPWEIGPCGADADSAWVTCTLASSPVTRKQYPFDFKLTVTHRLLKGAIVSLYEVAAGSNPGAMPFCIGNHIAFRVPFTGKGAYEDCTIRTPGNRRHLLTSIGLLSGRTRRINVTKPVPLNEEIYDDVFVMGYRRRTAWAELCDPNALTVRISQSEKLVGGRFLSRENDLAFVFWGRPEYNHICPEPWMGVPNALNSGKSLLRLPPNRCFRWQMRVAFKAM